MKGSPPRGPGRVDQRGFNELNINALSRLTTIPDALNRIEQAISTCMGQISARIGQVEADVLERVVWVYPYDPNRPGGHKRNEMVRDGRYVMIANKDTPDRAAPQPTGQPFWISEVPGVPSWMPQQTTASQLVIGQRYTWGQSGFIDAVRFYRSEVSPAIEYDLWHVGDPLGNPAFTKIAGPIVPSETGWFTLPQGQIIVVAGEVFDVFLVKRALDVPTTWSGPWNYKRSNGDPGEKEIYHQSAGGGREMRIHHIDDDETDRSTNLEGMQPGDEISGGGIDWTIRSATHELDHVRFEVDPPSRAQEDKYTFQFTTYAPQPISYHRADNHFSAESRVQGFYSESGYDKIVLDNHAYGVDIQVQQAIISPDWDLVAHSGQ